MLPTFLIIGAQKAATTSLYDYLRQHPEIFLDRKEPNFFLDEGRWKLGQAWYESIFEGAREAKHRGEASPAYTFFPFFRGAPERAAAVVPSARLIYLVRDPVKRMVSSWAQAVGDGHEALGLEEALVWRSYYTLASCYGLQLSRWAAHFPRERILVLRSEDLETDPGTTLDRVLEHLDLPAGWRPPNLGERLNPSEEKRIARAPVRRLAALLRQRGSDVTATALGPRRLPFLVRPMGEADLQLGSELAAALRDLFRGDFALLREYVGPQMDLWDIA